MCVCYKQIVVLPFKTIEVKGNNRVKGHSMRVHVMVEPPMGTYSDNIVTACIYSELKPEVYIQNVTVRPISLPTRTMMGKESTVTIVPQCWYIKKKTPVECRPAEVQGPSRNPTAVSGTIDLSGLEELSTEEQ